MFVKRYYRVSALWEGKQVSLEFPSFSAGSASWRMRKYYPGCDVEGVEFIREIELTHLEITKEIR